MTEEMIMRGEVEAEALAETKREDGCALEAEVATKEADRSDLIPKIEPQVQKPDLCPETDLCHVTDRSLQEGNI